MAVMPDSLGYDIVDDMDEIRIHNYLRVLAVSFLFYDHLITSGNEIEYLWKRPKTQSTYWFFLARYFAFFGNIAVTVLGFTLRPQDESCRQYATFRQLMLVLNQALVCILLGLRVYALYGCSNRVLIFLVGSGTLLLGVAFYSLVHKKSTTVEENGCHPGFPRATAIHLASTWEALFLYDCIIFSFTMARTWNRRHNNGITRISVPVVRLVFRDGAIYFAVMAVANLANISTFYFCGPFMAGGLSTFASCISVTMMSRLMLNLHKSADAGIYSTVLHTNTNVEYNSAWGAVELDTLDTGDLRFNPTTLATQSFQVDDDSMHFHSASLDC